MELMVVLVCTRRENHQYYYHNLEQSYFITWIETTYGVIVLGWIEVRLTLTFAMQLFIYPHPINQRRKSRKGLFDLVNLSTFKYTWYKVVVNICAKRHNYKQPYLPLHQRLQFHKNGFVFAYVIFERFQYFYSQCFFVE